MKLLFSIIIFICCNQLHAQKIAGQPFKRFGIFAGAGLANMNFNKGYMPATHYDAAWNTGVTLGFLISIPLAKNLCLQPEYIYTQRNSADKTIATNYALDYLSIPVLLSYKISSRFSVCGGPVAELLINAKSKSNGLSTDITHDTEERSIGITAGLAFQFYKNFFLSARYMQGLNHIGIDQRSNIKEFVYEVGSITAGIRF